jgi:hypothetical protein
MLETGKFSRQDFLVVVPRLAESGAGAWIRNQKRRLAHDRRKIDVARLPVHLPPDTKIFRTNGKKKDFTRALGKSAPGRQPASAFFSLTVLGQQPQCSSLKRIYTEKHT